MVRRLVSSLALASGSAALLLVESLGGCGEVARPTVDASSLDAGPKDGGPPLTDADADAAPTSVDPCGLPSGASATAPWPMLGGCAARPGSRKDTRAPSGPALGFSSDASSLGATAPVVAEGGVVVVGTSDGRLLAFSASGSLLWSAPTGGPVAASPVVLAGGDVAYATTAGKLGRVRVADGVAGPSAAGAPGPTALLPLADGTLAYTALDGKMHVAASADLAELEAVDVDSTVPLTLGVGGAILAAGRDGALRKVVRGRAPEVWFRASSALTSSAALSPLGVVLVASAAGRLHAVSADGAERWSAALEGTAVGAPAVAPDGSVYVATSEGKVRGFDRDGKEGFAFEPLGVAQPPIVAGGGTVLFGAEDTKLYAVQPSGRILFAASLRSRATSPAALGANGAVYLATESGVVSVGP
ncbi:MAG: PQQ-binding-like beta-propeller repeat protein [Myxococcales bacterium]|nr:PQQ-binding-like beta-propeller repeat protein [Myxococcales bacterium]